ncbi:MAG: NUDIX hydrolase [Clostridia bacterium]
MNLTETKIDSKDVFDGCLLHVKKDTVLLPNGKTSTREFIVHNGAVAVIPVLPDGKILMERQFRYPNHKVYLEIPAGKLELNEDPLEAAARELQEETGAVADKVEFLCDIQPTIAYSTEIIHIYVATGIHFVDTKLDEDEFVEIEKFELDELVKMILNNEIHDSKTCYGILHYYIKNAK